MYNINRHKAVIGAAGSYYTMTSKELQPCVEGVSLSGARHGWEGAYITRNHLGGVALGVSPAIQGRVARSAITLAQSNYNSLLNNEKEANHVWYLTVQKNMRFLVEERVEKNIGCLYCSIQSFRLRQWCLTMFL